VLQVAHLSFGVFKSFTFFTVFFHCFLGAQILVQFVMNVCRITEGRLFDFICCKQRFVETEAARFVYQLLDAVHYLHSCYIAHLDIKV